ncbi:hypothetical protein [Maribacter sp. 4G9]|uniref:hypothetical protein n=1 Tax=Maribacter sp. 4G9 TaxID=1889777 RepID=UPI000C1544F7|nr:hypothetical protein [Maribacter sp. 4G9]PIB28267.1 hypothetical protein BFP75_06065 [Maribacter sp. 4G9]
MKYKTIYIINFIHCFTVILLLTSCKEEKRVIEKIDFKTEYKFSSEIEEKVAKDTVPWKYQFSAADYATKGDYKNALIQWDLAMGTMDKNYTRSQIDSINQKYSKVKATEYIIEQAKKNRVVIINEAHHNSSHRVFTKSLLQNLFDNGYKNLGLEALSNGEHLDSILNNRKYPILKTGHYIKDPQFGNLVRNALEIGYNLFAYENMENGGGKLREIEQAKNIKKIIDSKPTEKFLIHCGFDHALEGTHNSWEKAMAGRLTEYTGINPLTINQVVYSEKSDPKFNHRFLKALDVKEPTILIDKDNNPLKYVRRDAWTDIAIFHPNTEYINERPNWLFENGNKNIPIVLTYIQIEFPVMVLAFKKGEDLNLAVPIDINEVESQTENCILGLKTGTYDIVVTNGKESVKFEQTVK